MCLSEKVEGVFCASHTTMAPVTHNSAPREKFAPAFNVASFQMCSGKHTPLSGSKGGIDV